MATITIKYVPDELHEVLKAQAKAHRRSVNSEVLRCLEAALRPRKVSAEERLGRIRSVRPRIDPEAVDTEEILAAIDEGRP